MKLALQIVGGIWAGLGALNIALMFIRSTSSSSTVQAFGLIGNMVLYVIPGLVLFGIGSMMIGKPKYVRTCPQCAENVLPAAIKCRFCGSPLPPMMPLPPIPPRPPMKRNTKLALAIAASGLALVIVVLSVHQSKIAAEERIRLEKDLQHASVEIAFIDAQSKLAKKYPAQAKEIRAGFLSGVNATDVNEHLDHQGWVTNTGAVYHVNIPVGKLVYRCEGTPNDQTCQ